MRQTKTENDLPQQQFSQTLSLLFLEKHGLKVDKISTDEVKRRAFVLLRFEEKGNLVRARQAANDLQATLAFKQLEVRQSTSPEGVVLELPWDKDVATTFGNAEKMLEKAFMMDSFLEAEAEAGRQPPLPSYQKREKQRGYGEMDPSITESAAKATKEDLQKKYAGRGNRMGQIDASLENMISLLKTGKTPDKNGGRSV